MGKKDYIYHYTSIETLALILSTRKIRFNSLGNVNDLNEAKTEDMADFGKYCLVSCWTKSASESIPLWNMYTPEMRGVRIGLPKDIYMFDKSFDPNKKRYSPSSAPLPYPDFINVEYCDTSPIAIRQNDGSVRGDGLGMTKSRDWEFENECRFRLFLVPYDNTTTRYANLSEFNSSWKTGEKIKNSKQTCDFLLQSDIIETMELMLGPGAGEPERIIVEALAEKYGIGTKQISKSSLRIRKRR